MEEIKVGEYVRLYDGEIGIVEKFKFEKKLANPYLIRLKGRNFGVNYVEKPKHSFNIKELIKAGDLITYKLKGIHHMHTGIIREYIDSRSGGVKSLGIDNYSLEQIEIIDIVTKELLQENKFVVQEMMNNA